MKPDTHLSEHARQSEVSDAPATSSVFFWNISKSSKDSVNFRNHLHRRVFDRSFVAA